MSRFRQASARATGRTPRARRRRPAAKDSSRLATGDRRSRLRCESETIEDVSSRVYGTPEHGDLLWRANRDTLPQRNSPLSTGMLLRTPAFDEMKRQGSNALQRTARLHVPKAKRQAKA